MFINYRAELLSIDFGVEHFTAVYERIDAATHPSPSADGDAIPMGPITNSADEVSS